MPQPARDPAGVGGVLQSTGLVHCATEFRKHVVERRRPTDFCLEIRRPAAYCDFPGVQYGNVTA
jgi:hypothetical protein